VLVNNVGIRRYEALADAPWETWDAIVRVNLLSFLSMARAALPALRQSGRGSIINVSSTYAIYGRKGMGAYDATKAAVLSLTRTLAFEEGGHGVRVNAICPGFTRTPFHVNRLGAAKVDELVPPCVLKRWADPKELAYPLLWLASDEASYVTAATFMIDGGLPA
jgi:2-hydroxycyclohexanecarboxyl-CoA dehydrogenase